MRGLGGTGFLIVCTLDRDYFFCVGVYRLSGNIFAEDSINASVLDSKEPLLSINSDLTIFFLWNHVGEV